MGVFLGDQGLRGGLGLSPGFEPSDRQKAGNALSVLRIQISAFDFYDINIIFFLDNQVIFAIFLSLSAYAWFVTDCRIRRLRAQLPEH
jgi:hypothetical protein